MSIALETQPRPRRIVALPQVSWLNHERTHLALLSLWAWFLFLYGIHQGDLYRTEGLRAIVGAEMYRSGDWIVPRLYGEPILTKPPLFYWCIALTGHLFGEVTTWSTRLPAALAGWAAVLLTYVTMRRYYGPRPALVAALALPASFLWLDKSSSAEIDTMLVMWVIAAWACFLRAMEAPRWWMLALLCVAGGVLTKWTAFLFFYATVIPTLLWHRRLGDLFRTAHLLAALLGAALVWCWLGAVVAELGWTQVWSSLWREGAPRVLHGKNASEKLLLETAVHPFKVFAIALPWSALAIFTWWHTRHQATGPQRFVERSLLCWALAGTAMMTLFPDHNTRQSFSLVPAWTLLGILGIYRLAQTWEPGTAQRLAVGGLLVWGIIKFAYVEILIPARFAQRPSLASQAAILRAFVPAPCYLYLRAVKDECLMFNYAQPVRRVPGWDRFDEPGEAYCVLTEAERRDWPAKLASRIVSEHSLQDAQGDPLVLVRLKASIP